MANINDYIERLYVGDENFKGWSNDDETQKVIDFLNGEISAVELLANGYTIRDAESLEGLEIQLKSEYSSTHYVSLIHVYDDENGRDAEFYSGEDAGALQLDFSLPKEDYNSFMIIISSKPFQLFMNDSSLVDTEFLIAGAIGIWGEVPLDIGDIDLPVINPSDYIESLTINNGQTDISNVAVDRSVFVEEMFYGAMNSLIGGRYAPTEDVTSIELTLKPEYEHLYIFTYRVIEYQGYIMPVDVYDSERSPIVLNLSEIPYTPIAAEDFIFMLSPVPFEDIDAESLNDLVAFGVGFSDVVEEEPDVDLPPVEVNPTDLDSTQFIEVLDGTSLRHYSYVPDVYNVKISQTINGPYTLSFNLQPYTNASNIYTPRIVHCDGEYFHVQQITKRSQLENLEMDVLCEHVSYELNYPPQTFWDELKQDYVWTEDTYHGTASEILEELLGYNYRFRIGTVDNDMTEHTFTTSSEGFRTRINEFASQIGLEVRWDKFNISLLRKRGRDHGLTLQVGTNIIGLTEIIDTVKLGKVKRSYEIEALDLNYIYDESDAPLEVHNIVLGDVITIVDENYRIQRKDRVVSIARDPFEKALPTIEFLNSVNTFTSDTAKNGTIKGVSGSNIEIYQEYIARDKKANALGYNIWATGLHSFGVGFYSNAYGDYSIAMGNQSDAQANNSVAIGEYNKAIGDYSHAIGRGTRAFGEHSYSEGYYTEAEGTTSHAEGRGTNAVGDYSHSEGYYSIARGLGSHAEGYVTEAGYMSHSEGYDTAAEGWFSHSQNCQTLASGDASSSHGYATISNGAYSLVCGIANRELYGAKPIGFADSFDHLFAVGNGTVRRNSETNLNEATRSNAFSVRRSGQVYANGQYHTSGADYSEFFEWFDGNSNGEDRKGYAVTFEGDKIRLANANDEYILGVVSVNPSVVGNSYEEQWHGMYITDEWGNIEYSYEDVPYEEIDENGELIKTLYRKNYVPKINPDYSQDEPYTPRSQRQEWATVGMLGKLLVRDDGTCQINKYARLSETVDGVLSNSTERTQFFVLRRVSENVVEVLIK